MEGTVRERKLADWELYLEENIAVNELLSTGPLLQLDAQALLLGQLSC